MSELEPVWVKSLSSDICKALSQGAGIPVLGGSYVGAGDMGNPSCCRGWEGEKFVTAQLGMPSPAPADGVAGRKCLMNGSRVICLG